MKTKSTIGFIDETVRTHHCRRNDARSFFIVELSNARAAARRNGIGRDTNRLMIRMMRLVLTGTETPDVRHISMLRASAGVMMFSSAMMA